MDKDQSLRFRGPERLGMRADWPQAERWLEGVIRLDDDSFVVLTGVEATLISANQPDETKVSPVLEATPVEIGEDGVGIGEPVLFQYSKVKWMGSNQDDFHVAVEWPMQGADDLPTSTKVSDNRKDGRFVVTYSGAIDPNQIRHLEKTNVLNVVYVCNSKGVPRCDSMGFFDRKAKGLKDGRVLLSKGEERTCDVKLNACVK